MTYPFGFRLLSSLLLLLLVAGSGAHAQVRRCTATNGTSVFTDRRCQDIGAIEHMPQSSAASGARLYRSTCSRNLQDLVYELTTAIDSRDVNRLAGVYQWTGTSTRTGYALMQRLDAIAQRPLVDIVPVYRPAPMARMTTFLRPRCDAGPSDCAWSRRWPMAARRRAPCSACGGRSDAGG